MQTNIFSSMMVIAILALPVPVRAQGLASGATDGIVKGKPQARQEADRVGARIAELHKRLHVTPAQETLWSTVAGIMRDNATALRASLVDQSAKRDLMTAVDDLKTFQIIADQHSNGLKKFIPAFEALYRSMTPAQQKFADRVFREHRRHSGF